MSNSGGQTSNLQPKADLTGVVVDTNSQPVQGATVAVAGRTATTDASGVWVILDVAVVDTSSQDGSDPQVNNNLTIVVTPPSGYMGGIIEVYPQAEVVSSEAFFEENDDASSGETNPQLLLLDGYLVNTGTLALPKLAATVELLGIQEGSTGQPVPSGTPIALDFQRSDAGTIGANCIGGSFTNDEDNNGINFQPANVSFSGTVGANGNVTFSGLPENSCLNVVLQGWDFTNCGSAGLDDNEPEAPCSSGKAECTGKRVAVKGIAKASNAGDICLITTNREVLPRTYVDMRAERLVASGDNVYPYLVSVTGVFNDVPAFDEDNVNLNLNSLFNGGRLVDGVNETFVFNFSETLAAGLTEANVLVFNEDTQTYETVEDVTQSGKTVTVTLAEAQDPGTTLKFYLLLPQFRDLAGNPLLVGPNTSNVDDPIGYDFGSVDDICTTNCPAISYVGVRLCIYREPVVNPGAVTIVQEEVDPRLSGALNDAAVNQTRSVSFNDVRDQGGNVESVTFFRIVQQMNAPAELEVPVNIMNRLGFAFTGTSPDVDNDVPRIEWEPIANVTSYRINVTQFGGLTTWTYDTGAGDFPPNNYSDDCESAPALFVEHCETAAVVRDGTLVYAFMYEGAQEGDVVTVQAIDDLGNPSQLSNELVIVDNVEPTVALQRSYQDLHDYPGAFNGITVEDSTDVANNASDCYVRPDPNAPGAGAPVDDPDDTVHAGVVSVGGVDDGGSGGEVTNPGAEASVGDVCLGISPELMITTNDTDDDINTAHDDLVAGRDSSIDDTIDALDEAYDADAWTSWAAADRATVMGIAFTEPLASVGTPSYTGSAGLFGTFTVQEGQTVNAPTVNALLRADLEYLVRVPVSDPLALANDDHNEVLGFVGATDLAGNAATAAAAPFLDIRDQWAPYIANAVRDEDGDLLIEFNEPVVIEVGDVLTFGDTDLAVDTVTFVFGAANFTQSVDGTTITIDNADLPALAGVLDDPELTYDDSNGQDTQHFLIDWRTIHDERGNAWEVYARSFADGVAFGDDVPVFIAPDLLGTFRVDVGQETVVAGATDFIFELVATHPICNIGNTETCPNTNPAVLFGLGGDLVNQCGPDGADLGTAEVGCPGSFVANYLSVGANCTIDTANSSATISADKQTILFEVSCSGGSLLAGDVVGLNGTVGNAGDARSELDDTQVDSALDTTTAEAP